MNKMDELFKRKLESHSLLPSADAWNKIESNLEKKSKPFIWWRAVAAVLLLGAMLWAGYLVQSGKKVEQPLTEKKIEKKKTEKAEQHYLSKEEKVESRTEKIEKPIIKNLTAYSTTKKEIKTIIKENKTTSTTIEKPVENVAELNEAITTPVKIETREPVASLAQTAKNEKPIVLEFRLEPLTSEVVIAAKQEKKKLKTILTDLKSGETSINFQTLKENLLAFNSKKPKVIETQE
jgi:hypothetical protein